MAVIIEVLGWGGKSRHHYRVEGPSISIGRGYQNDVVLSDSHISANHLRLDAVENGWQLTDLDSLNGVEIIKNPSINSASTDGQAATTLLADGAEIKVGRTRLRVIADSHPVEAAKELHRLEKDVSQLNRFSIWLPLLLLVMTIDIAALYANSFVEWQWKNALPSILFTQVFLLMLALFWGAVGRFLREEANFLGHYNLILLATLVYSAIDWLLGVIGYNFSAGFFIDAVAPLANLVLVAVLLSANFALATNMLARQRWITSVGFVLLILVVSVANQLQEWGEFSPYPEYFSALELPALQIGGGESVDEFIDGLDDLFAKADQLAEEK
ncbi:MAG: FHA domain-containing protein [Porticoccaceae bacterium]